MNFLSIRCWQLWTIFERILGPGAFYVIKLKNEDYPL